MPSRSRSSALFMALAASAALSGCASYSPAPVSPTLIAQKQAITQIDVQAVRSELQSLAPNYHWDGKTWDSLTLFAAAMSSSPEAVRAHSTLVAAEANARAARVGPGPSFTLTAEYAFNPAESSPWLVGAAGDALLDVGGRRRGRIEAADIAVKQAQLDYTQSIWAIRMSVRIALLNTRFSRREAESATQVVAFRQRQFNSMTMRVEAGEVSRADLERARNDLASAQLAQSSASAAAERAHLDLAAALGVAPSALDSITLSVEPQADFQLPLPDKMIDAALVERTDILRAMSDYDRSETAYRTAVASQFPEVHISPGYTWERGLTKLPLAMTFNFPSWDLNAAAIHSAETVRADSGANLEAVVAGAMANIVAAQSGYRSAQTTLSLLTNESIRVAARLAKQADNELAEGSINRADWAAAQAGYASAKFDLVTAERRTAEALISLEDALRMPLAGSELLVEGAASAEKTTP